MKFEDYEQVVRGLIRDIEKRNSRFLVGAGVSMLYPCSLPSGAELKDLALFEFLKHSELEGLIKKIRNHWKYGSIVPEVIFQRIYEALREDLYPFFNVLNFANSNLGHEVIAHIIHTSGINVFTTNFDMLIEKHIVTEVDRVIHLHGSLGDHSQMMVRINQVGRGLDSSLKNSIKSELDGKNLYVLGYSGNDKDIVDTLNSCRPEKIIWLVRSRKDDFVIANIKRLNQNVKLRITEGDLTDLFEQLAATLSIARKSSLMIDDPRELKSKRLSYLHEISSKLSSAAKFACYGKVFFELEEYNSASEVYVNAVKNDFSSGIHNKYWFYAEAANCMRIIGHFDKGMSYLTQVINDSNSSNYLSILAASYNNYGLILLEKDKPEPMEAIKYFSEAIKTLDRFSKTTEGAAWEEGIRVFRGRFYNNLGLAFETADNFEDSLGNYKESLKIKRATGDLIGISHTSANIAVLYYKFHKYKKASYWKRSVIKLTDKYQLSYQRAYMLRRLGEINCERGRTKQGQKLLQEALQILKKLEGVIFDLELSEKALNACKKPA